MKLRDLITADAIVYPLVAASISEAVALLADRAADGASVVDTQKLRDRASTIASDDMVGIGDRALLVHFRTDAVHQLCVALGVSPEGVPREDGENVRAQVILLVVAPPPLVARHLQVVRGFARLFAREGVVDGLVEAGDAESCRSLAAFAEDELAEQLTVRDVMTDRPRTTGPDVPLRDAARELIRAGLGALPVVDAAGRLVGMLSERELVRHLLTTRVLSDPLSRPHAPIGGAQRTVRDVMTRQVLCVAPEQPVAEVASLMSNKDVERVPVVRDGTLVGYLTRGDIVRKLIGS